MTSYFDIATAATQRLIEHRVEYLLLTLFLGAATYLWWSWSGTQASVPALPDIIPYVSNTYQYMSDQTTFLSRARKLLSRSNIISFYLGTNKVYFITRAHNVQAMFRTSSSISSDKFILFMIKNLWGATEADVAKFVNDKSGRLSVPAAGTETTASGERYWAGFHRIVHDYLARTQEADKIADSFERLLSERLARYPLGEWSTVRICDFLRSDVAESAVVSLAGSRILELNPDLLRKLWDFDEIAASIAWGPPKWMKRDAWNKRDALRAACAKYLDAGWAAFDWDGPDADADWEPNFGARYSRELARWMREADFAPQTCAGIVAVSSLFGQNGNTIPITTWAVMELAKDPVLFKAVREEFKTVLKVDATTGRRYADKRALFSLPLLQSVYTEVLRLHVSINVTREVVGPLTMEGLSLEKGSLVQAPSEIAHREESIWSTPGHPASEFWAERHVRHVDAATDAGEGGSAPQFSLAGRSNDFFPYGGGISMCPGRFFAKHEIMLTMGLLASRFDVEFVSWTMPDGSPSDRPAQNDARWAGAVGVPPDRDMTVRWKRLW